MGQDHTAGALRERVEVLELAAVEGGWEWHRVRETWASIELSDRTNLFAKTGVGARDAALVLRRQALTLHHALRWRGQHMFLTSLAETRRGWLDGKAALVEAETVRLKPEDGGVAFPAVVTEKYIRHDQEWPMSVNELCLVLVVPKPVVLRPGRLVEVREADWEVLVPHELDPYKNEYEIGRRMEL